MKPFIPSTDNLRLLHGCWNATRYGISARALLEVMELLPSLIFYATQAITVFALFQVIGGVAIPWAELAVFIGILICIDACGDAIFLYGIQEYCSSLVRGQTVYYLFAPGSPLLKIYLYRVDYIMLMFGGAVGLATLIAAGLLFGANPLTLAVTMAVGAWTHIVLTSAFHIVQAYWDPTRPIRLGSPATRFYTRPLHLVFRSTAVQIIVMLVYPAYFATAFPAIVATGFVPPTLPFSPWLVFASGAVSLLVWAVGLNWIVRKSCVKFQG